MSLRQQFFLSVILALVLALGLESAVAVWHARRSVENEMHKALEAADRIVDNGLVSLPVQGRAAYLDRLVHGFDGNRHVRVTLTTPGGPASAPAMAEPVPGWFVRLLGIGREVRIDTGEGVVMRVESDPHNEISESWGQLRDSAAILALFSLVVLALLHLAMARMARPLARLSAGFDALGSGDYAARVTPQGPRELSYLGRAFNRMAQRLGVLETANRRMAGQMLAIQEEERADLARDLHDEMGPFLFAVRVDAEAIATQASSPAIAERAHAIAAAVRHIQAQVRQILKQLRPSDVPDVGLGQAVANLARFWQRHHPHIAIALEVEADSFGREMDAAIFRLVQEGLTNAARHSSASHVWVRVQAGDAHVDVTVEDDGVGFGASEGMGLSGMRERLAALSGRLTLGERPGGGARLAARIPRMRAMEAQA